MPRMSMIDAICGLVWLPAAVFLGGCDEGPAGRGPQPAEATPGRVTLTPSEPTPGRFKPVETPDDPAVPVAFPGEVAGWVKAEPARAVLGRELDEVLTDPDRRARWRPYNLAMVATSRYQRDASGGVQTARVQLVQAHDAEDAYGVFSVESAAAGSAAANAVIRVDTPNGSDLSAWKGRFFLRISATLTGSGPQRDEAVEACRALLQRIRFALPDADAPAILDTFPDQGPLEPSRWLVRSTRSLTGTVSAMTSISASDQIDKLLGLNRDTLMAVAHYPGQAGGGPNRPWLVRYDGAVEARAAHRRYRAYLDRSTDPAAADTLLATLKGRYLIGTWSAEEESISRLLPQIRQRLPD